MSDSSDEAAVRRAHVALALGMVDAMASKVASRFVSRHPSREEAAQQAVATVLVDCGPNKYIDLAELKAILKRVAAH